MLALNELVQNGRWRMVYKYVRKTNRGSWSEDNLQKAMAEASKSSITKAAKDYGIPYATLYRHIKSRSTEKKLGRYSPVLTREDELELVAYVKKVDALFYGLTRKELLSLAGEFAKAKNQKKAFKKDVAGKDWFRGFRQRNPEIVLRKPEPTSIARVQGFNKQQVQRFYDLLDEQTKKHKFDPTTIYNMDETGIKTTTSKPPKVLSTYGKRQVGMVASAERGTLTTVIACCNAAGSFLPPFMIFKRKKACPRLLDGAPPGSQATFTDSGWINAEKFYDWMVYFVEKTRPTPENKVLLILDNHDSHKAYDALQYASDHNVIMLTIPPHTSHKLQPLDVAVFGPFKTYFEQEIFSFQKQHPGRVIHLLDVSRLFAPAYLRAATPMNAISAFRAAGICPFNRHIFGEEIYIPSTLVQDPQETTTSNVEDPLQLSVPACSGRVCSLIRSTASLTKSAPATAVRAITSSPSSTVPVPDIADKVSSPTKTSESELNLSQLEAEAPQACTPPPIEPVDAKTPSPKQNTGPPENVTPASLRPIPVYARTQISKRKRKIQKAEVLTSTPIKEEQKTKLIKKKATEIKKEAQQKKRMPKYLMEEPKPSSSGIKNKKPKRTNKDDKKKEKKKGTEKEMTNKKTNNENEDIYCITCKENYESPPQEDWIQCAQCERWCHELCSNYTGFGSYFCDFCDD